jgi:myosin-heavy-chain kinase
VVKICIPCEHDSVSIHYVTNFVSFKGLFDGSSYAILQSKPSGYSEEYNKKDLLDELALMMLGQYFLDSFYERVKAYKVKGLPREFQLYFQVLLSLIDVPGMQWNLDGAFVGVIKTELPQPPGGKNDDNIDDDQSLVFKSFLATRLLPSGPSYTEEKFSGNIEVGDNSGSIGHAVNTYAHHIVVDSHKTVLFADLQGTYAHTSTVM